MSPSRARFALVVGGTALVLFGIVVWSQVMRPWRAARLLEQAAAADGKVPYRATAKTKVLYGSDVLESEAKIASDGDGKSAIRYEGGSLDGVAMGNDGARVWRYDPRAKRVYTSPPPISATSPLGQKHVDLILSNYRVTEEGREDVAKRPAYRILLTPKQPGANSRRLWIDRETNIILASEERDSQGHLVAKTVFDSIDYDRPPSPKELKAPPPQVAPRKRHSERFIGVKFTPAELSKEIGFTVRVPSYVPEGYVADGSYLYHCPECHETASETRYTNGMDSFSLFQGREVCDAHGKGGHVSRVGNRQVVSWKHGDDQFCVIGSLSLEELKRIAASLPGGSAAAPQAR